MMMYELGSIELQSNSYSYRNCDCCGKLVAFLVPRGTKRKNVTIVCDWCEGEFAL